MASAADESPAAANAEPVSSIASLVEAVHQTRAFAWRAIRKMRQTPEQLLDVLVLPILFTVMFTFLLGGAIAGTPDAYLQFLLPGILAQTVMFTSIYTGVTLKTDVDAGVHDRFRTLPIWQLAPVVGAMAGDLLRHLISASVVIIVGLVLGFHPAARVSGILAALALLLLFAFGLGWVFATLALVLKSPGSVLTIGSLIIFPFTFVSNLFVDPSTMPDWLQPIVTANPVTQLIEALRAAMAGSLTLPSIAAALVAPLVLVSLFAPLALAAYGRSR